MRARTLRSLALLVAGWIGATATDTRSARSMPTTAPPMPRSQVAPPATIEPRPPEPSPERLSALAHALATIGKVAAWPRGVQGAGERR